MGQVIINYRLMPSGVEVDVEELKQLVVKAVKSIVKGELGFKVTPIAFGLKALDVAMVIAEEEDDAVQKVLNGLDKVQSVSVLSASLV